MLNVLCNRCQISNIQLSNQRFVNRGCTRLFRVITQRVVVINCNYYLCNDPEECRSLTFQDRSLKSRIDTVQRDVIAVYFEVNLHERNIASLHDESSKNVCLHRLLSSFVCRKDCSEVIKCLSEQFMRYVVWIAVYVCRIILGVGITLWKETVHVNTN